ncbi:hypothetical protein RND71_002039 [Anisodus tanguticus]|uniref:Uncharacterized protein n=1 Tax=Anisodus tanguticus TaxID=243964 RepID=A0AAE1T396_9SOLA|nr:hypothetical protein RND71_002039 [Anisodus tanguticus]
MFGHINCHPVRGWKIVYPPPTFDREEKFAELQAHMEPNMQVTDDAPLLPDLNVSKRRTERTIFNYFLGGINNFFNRKLVSF